MTQNLDKCRLEVMLLILDGNSEVRVQVRSDIMIESSLKSFFPKRPFYLREAAKKKKISGPATKALRNSPQNLWTKRAIFFTKYCNKLIKELF